MTCSGTHDDDCDTCNPSAHREFYESGSHDYCICSDGYYEDGHAECATCDSSWYSLNKHNFNFLAKNAKILQLNVLLAMMERILIVMIMNAIIVIILGFYYKF